MSSHTRRPLSRAEEVALARSKIPLHFRVAPQLNEEVLNPFLNREEVKRRLNDWAFTEGFAVVVRSSDQRNQRVVYACVHHSEETRDTRNNKEWDRLVEEKESGTNKRKRRRETTTQKLGCQFKLTVRWIKERKKWGYMLNELSHSHDMAEDPLQYREHKHRKPKPAEVEIAQNTAEVAGVEIAQNIVPEDKFRDRGGLMLNLALAKAWKYWEELPGDRAAEYAALVIRKLAEAEIEEQQRFTRR